MELLAHHKSQSYPRTPQLHVQLLAQAQQHLLQLLLRPPTHCSSLMRLTSGTQDLKQCNPMSTLVLVHVDDNVGHEPKILMSTLFLTRLRS